MTTYLVPGIDCRIMRLTHVGGKKSQPRIFQLIGEVKLNSCRMVLKIAQKLTEQVYNKV